MTRVLAFVTSLALLLSWPAALARAEAPADGITHESLAGSVTLLTDEGQRVPVLFAREELRYRSGRLQLAARVEGNAEGNGQTQPVLTRPETFTTIEAYALGSYRMVGSVAACAVAGITRPTIGTPGPTRETWLAGALIGYRERWVLVGAGVRRVVGDDIAAMAAWRVRLTPKTVAVGDAVGIVRGGRLVYQARAGVALSIAGAP